MKRREFLKRQAPDWRVHRCRCATIAQSMPELKMALAPRAAEVARCSLSASETISNTSEATGQ